MTLERKLKQHLADARYNGRQLDEAFIAPGFVGIEGEINLLDAAFGNDSYRAFLTATSSERERASFRRKSDALRDEFLSARSIAGGLDPVIGRLISDPAIPGQGKHELLRRFAPQRAMELLTPLMAAYRSSIERETALICKMHREPCLSLLGKSTLKTRKAIYNEVSVDAFHHLGFQAKKRTRGPVTLAKQIDSGNIVEVELDHHTIENHHFLSGSTDATAYWRKIFLGMNMTLIHRSRRADAIEIPLGVAMNAIAMTRMTRFDCSCSLEVAIRAHAFLYEWVFLPFEPVAMGRKPPDRHHARTACP
jgi:hypothetical protein